MMSFPLERLLSERHSELLREAGTRHLLKQSQAEGNSRHGSAIHWLARLGGGFAVVGQNLRNRHRSQVPGLNLPCCPERQP